MRPTYTQGYGFSYLLTTERPAYKMTDRPQPTDRNRLIATDRPANRLIATDRPANRPALPKAAHLYLPSNSLAMADHMASLFTN